MRKLLIIPIIILTAIYVNAQNITDVVRWSSIDYLGTARVLGSGSSFGAMGGDFSVININPAGIGDYRISEFTLTPSLRGSKSSAWFTQDSLNISAGKSSKLGLDNIGFVLASNPGGTLTSSNFAFGYSRIADLNQSFRLAGNKAGSITYHFANEAQGKSIDDLDDFIGYPAYYTGAIFEGDNNEYSTDFPNDKVKVATVQDVYHSGGINELTMGWAGEYDNQLNFGVSVGVPFPSFEQLKTYKESDPNDDIEYFDDLTFTERLHTSGVGFNFKTGFTYKIQNVVRIAGVFHSPTWYKFTDDYSTSLEYVFTDAIGTERTSYDSPGGVFEYKITTPWRAIGSIGTTLRLGEIRGFINGDIEFVDYTNARYNGTAYLDTPSEQQWTQSVNQEILTKLGTATNIRLGGEFGYKGLRLRGGYSIERTAYNADDFYNNKVSFGLGFRADRFFMDLGIRIAQYNEGYYPYYIDGAKNNPLANIETERTRGNLTLGFKF